MEAESSSQTREAIEHGTRRQVQSGGALQFCTSKRPLTTPYSNAQHLEPSQTSIFYNLSAGLRLQEFVITKQRRHDSVFWRTDKVTDIIHPAFFGPGQPMKSLRLLA